MDSIKSFKGYGMVDEPEEKSYRKKTRKRVIIASLSSIVLVVIIVGAIAGALVNKNKENSRKNSSVSTSTAAELKSVCDVTEHKKSCFSSMSELNTANSTDPEAIFLLSLQVAKHSINKLSALPQEWMSKTDDPFVKKAIEVCGVVFDEALDKVTQSISLTNAKNGGWALSVPKINDLKTWLSAAITNQETCLDSLEEANAPILEEVKRIMKNSTEFASNSLAIVTKIFGVLGDLGLPLHRKLLEVENTEVFPDWIGKADKRLLREVKPRPNVTVAHDGTGDVRTLKEAFEMVELKSEHKFIVHVKAGKYVENVVLNKSFWNIMMYGDGKINTIISGSLSYADNITTFDTPTFAISGRGFIARDIGFENTAGPEKHQAVAMRSGSDLSVFYKCSFNAFQDTLYAHSNRQFYRECDITGTIDFIFGNAAVVLQNCNIQPRQPLPKQLITITAQGKKDPNQNTGISIQKCSMSPFNNLTAPAYLGRPWKPYSTTIIMQSEIGGFLNPGGWVEWESGVEPPSSIFYAEYENSGPGANVENRVKWDGYKSMLTKKEASKFTVESFIQGNNWLMETGVIFDAGL
ncbi:hypothetical protein Leryth_005130 [Lithospermum erythrorhizon]|nr:hypothetical protein Leryth_005130 [Lithospermum erythrorhizon]